MLKIVTSFFSMVTVLSLVSLSLNHTCTCKTLIRLILPHDLYTQRASCFLNAGRTFYTLNVHWTPCKTSSDRECQNFECQNVIGSDNNSDGNKPESIHIGLHWQTNGSGIHVSSIVCLLYIT